MKRRPARQKKSKPEPESGFDGGDYAFLPGDIVEVGCSIAFVACLILLVHIFTFPKSDAVLQAFLALPFHHFFILALIPFIVVLLFFRIRAFIKNEILKGRKYRGTEPLTFFITIWLIIGLFKGSKYGYFSALSAGEVMDLMMQSISSGFAAIFQHDATASGIDTFMAQGAFWSGIYWLLERLWRFVLPFAQKRWEQIHFGSRFCPVDAFYLCRDMIGYILALWFWFSVGGILWICL